MELGNLLFGNSRGTYPVPRNDEWGNCFSTLLQLIEGSQYDGYGTEFVCDVFELHRYYWGDCACGFDEADSAWSQHNPHLNTCNRTINSSCPCGIDARYHTWRKTHDHETTCPIIRPNFAYAPMGFSLKWYKYPFRDAYMSHPLTFEEFRTIINACITWLRDHPNAIPTREHTNFSRNRTISAHPKR